MFSGLSSLVIEDVTDRDGLIAVRARTAGGPVPCPRCGVETGHAITCAPAAPGHPGVPVQRLLCEIRERGWIHPSAPSHPAQLTPRIVTTESATEPFELTDPPGSGAGLVS